MYGLQKYYIDFDPLPSQNNIYRMPTTHQLLSITQGLLQDGDTERA